MRISRRGMGLLFATSLAFASLPEAKADLGTMAMAAWKIASPFLIELGKGVASAVGTLLVEYGAEAAGLTGTTIEKPAQLDRSLQSLRDDLKRQNQTMIADAVDKLRAELKPGMKFEDYLKNVVGTVKDLDKRLGALEADNQALHKLVDSLSARVEALEKNNQKARRVLEQGDELGSCVATLQSARADLKGGDVFTAITKLTNALQPAYAVSKAYLDTEVSIDLRNAIAYIMMARGDAYREVDLDELAIIDYTSASLLMTGDKRRAGCFETRADLLLVQNKPKLALEDYNRAVKLQSDVARLYAKRAKTYRALNDGRNAAIDELTVKSLGQGH